MIMKSSKEDMLWKVWENIYCELVGECDVIGECNEKMVVNLLRVKCKCK